MVWLPKDLGERTVAFVLVVVGNLVGRYAVTVQGTTMRSVTRLTGVSVAEAVHVVVVTCC